jgi:uncharacterized membrane protein YcaP (DUF421 family)
MENLFAIHWSQLFEFSVSPMETIIRGSFFYWFLFLIFRFIIRRDIGAVGLADVLIIVIVADASQNAMAGEYTSISDGMILVSTLIGWNVFFDWLSYRSSGFRRFAEPPPLLLIRDGQMQLRNMRKELITEEELSSKLRQAGLTSLEQVKEAYIEADGEISIIKRS